MNLFKKFKEKYKEEGFKLGYLEGAKDTKKEYENLISQLVINQIIIENDYELNISKNNQIELNEYSDEYSFDDLNETNMLNAVDDIMLWFNSLIEITNTNFIVDCYFDSKNYNSTSMYELIIFIEFAINSSNIKKLYPKTHFYLPELKKVFIKVYNNKLLHEEAERLGRKKIDGDSKN